MLKFKLQSITGLVQEENIFNETIFLASLKNVFYVNQPC